EHRVTDPTVSLRGPNGPDLVGIEQDDVRIGATAMVPFRGNRPKSRAGAVEVSSTKRFSDNPCRLTPPSKISGSRVSTPGAPFGILLKSLRPCCLENFKPYGCSLKQKGQWSVEITWRSSVLRP